MATMRLHGGPCDGKQVTVPAMVVQEEWLEASFMEPGVPGTRFEHHLYVLDGEPRFEADVQGGWEWQWDHVYAGPSPRWPGGRWRGADPNLTIN